MNHSQTPVIAIPESQRGFSIDENHTTVHNIATAVINRMLTMNGRPGITDITVHFSIKTPEWITMKSWRYATHMDLEQAIDRVVRTAMRKLVPQPQLHFRRCQYMPIQTGIVFIFTTA